jgi:hypothetical protein
MKHEKVLLVIGIWFVIIPLSGIPLGAKKFLLLIPALFLIFIAITGIRDQRKMRSELSRNQEELIHEIAEDIAEDIVGEADATTQQEMKRLRDII